MHLKYLVVFFVLAVACCSCEGPIHLSSHNQGINITPKPLELTVNNGYFLLNSNTAFITTGTPELDKMATFFITKLKQSTGYDLSLLSELPENNYILLALDSTLALNEEGYTLSSTPRHIEIKGNSPRGIFYGLQTLLQLLPAEIESKEVLLRSSWDLPAVDIRDEPRFEWRGFHLDVCRHFITVDEIKKHLDMLAIYKINKFHWHLTEDQGWRIEIKKYPRLTTVGATRTEADGSVHQGYYTQDEIREVVAYAAERYIDVIPEIEMPGHALAALSAYPELSCTGQSFTPRIIWGVETDIFCAGKEAVFTFLEEVVKEILPLFPYQYYHLGGDEAPKARWEACSRCQQRIQQEGLADADALQSYFMKRMEKVLQSHGKQMIGWDEILEGGISDTANVMSWRGEAGGIAAANAGNDVIMSPGEWLYMDKYEGDYRVDPVTIGGLLPLEKVYQYDPIPVGIDGSNAHHILGAQTAMWSEYIYKQELTEYRMYPRILALAELTWTAKALKDYPDFERRLNNQMVRMDSHDIDYYIPMPEGPAGHVAFTDSVTVPFTTPRPVARMVYTLDGSEPTPNALTYTKPMTFKENTTLKIASVLAHGKMSRIRTIKIEKQTLSPATEVTLVSAGLTARSVYGNFLSTKALQDITEWKKRNVSTLEEVNETLHWGHVIDENKFRAEIIEGFIKIPEDGVYYFSSNVDQVWIDGRLVIDNDGFVKRFSQNDGAMALSKGLHPLKVIYLNNVYRGWASDWNDVTLRYRKSTEQAFKPVGPDMLYRETAPQLMTIRLEAR